MWHDADAEPEYSEYIELDLSTVVASIAGPKRPQDRVELTRAKEQFELDLNAYASVDLSRVDASVEGTFPASDPIGLTSEDEESAHAFSHSSPSPSNHSNPAVVQAHDGSKFTIDHGAVAVAALTSCTNTSNPSVMIAAGLLARNASLKGLKSKPWVKTTLAPGSKVVTDYYAKAGLNHYLEDLGFYLVGYGCTVCIGNTGPLLSEEVSAAVAENDLAVASVLSGNRNFEGRIQSQIKMNYLASPPLVIAYALAGSMDFDFEKDSARRRHGRQRGVPEGHLAGRRRESADGSRSTSTRDMFNKQYAAVFDGDERWRSLPTPTGATFEWR